METTRHHICIYHVILVGLEKELNLHLPLQAMEFGISDQRKLNSSAIICVRMVVDLKTHTFPKESVSNPNHGFGHIFASESIPGPTRENEISHQDVSLFTQKMSAQTFSS